MSARSSANKINETYYKMIPLSSLSSLDTFLFKMNEEGVESTQIASDEQADVNCELVQK